MTLRLRTLLLSICLLCLAFLGSRFLLTGTSSNYQIQSTDRNDPTHPAQTRNWVDTQLYFGLGPADAPDKGVPESAWRDFLDHEVTPRFPSGLSVQEVYGQWQSPHRPTPERIRSKVLIIVYPNTPDNASRIEAIRLAWKQRTHDQSVLKVTQPAEVSF